MFKVIKDPQFVEDVTVEMADGQGWQTQTLRTRFRMLPNAEILALTTDETLDIAAVVDRAVVGFENLCNVDGNPIEDAGG